MPYLSSATTMNTNATTYKLSSPNLTSTNMTPPIELAPISNTCNLDNRPLSPDSPKIIKLFYSSSCSSSLSSCSSTAITKLPLVLEPRIDLYPTTITHQFPLDLFKKTTCRSFNVNNNNQQSPTMIPVKKRKVHQVDQSVFLTKNAHIKRPRNAWIHFRCYYGQALKSEDPTLRAEEISKRASEHWGKLTENEKKPWHNLAEKEKLAHREAFPEYRYCPRRSRQRSSSTD